MYTLDILDKTERLQQQVAQLKQRVDMLENILSNAKDVLTLEEAAIYTGISCSSLYKMTHTHSIPFYKPNGKRVFFEKKELLGWIRQNHTAATAAGSNGLDGVQQ